MFNGNKPAGQPRTARSIAESEADPKNFPEDIPHNYQAGMPTSETGGSSSYNDAAVDAATSPMAGRSEEVPPFTITRPAKK